MVGAGFYHLMALEPEWVLGRERMMLAELVGAVGSEQREQGLGLAVVLELAELEPLVVGSELERLVLALEQVVVVVLELVPSLVQPVFGLLRTQSQVRS